MSKLFWFKDYISVPTDNVFTDASQLLEDINVGGAFNPHLRVTIRATHSGYLLNNRVYPGKGVRDGAPSWVSRDNGGNAGYDKPILLHHEGDADPVGRIDYQQYVPLWKDQKFDEDWKHPDVGINPGSGFIVLSGKIADRDAQERILDGRYKTVSTGQTSDKALCSICGSNWAGLRFFEDPPCDHKPGKAYEVDGKNYLAYLVTGKLTYMECSFVNHPANQMATVVGVDADPKITTNEDSGEPELKSNDTAGDIYSIKLYDNQGNSTELIKRKGEEDEVPYGEGNVKKNIFVSVPPNKRKGAKANPAQGQDGIQKVTLPTGEVFTVGGDGSMTKVKSPDDEEPASSDKPEIEMLEDEFALANIARSMQNAGILIDDELDTEECELTFEECIDLIGQLKDAKLSAAQRKKLKGSSFCGPNRSFPVPDCAHVTAARRLIGRAKVSSATKQRILACVSRKAKAMGCGSKDSDQGVANMSKDTKDQAAPVDEKALTVLQRALEDAQSKSAELEAELAKQKQLYDSKVNEYNTLLDENAGLTGEFKKQLASQLVTLQMQLMKPTVSTVKDAAGFDVQVEELAGRTIDSLRDSIADLVPELSDSFKRTGLPSFVRDRTEGKPPVQKSTKPEGNPEPKPSKETKNPSSLI